MTGSARDFSATGAQSTRGPQSEPERMAQLDALLDRISEHIGDAKFSGRPRVIKRALIEAQFAIHDALAMTEELH